MRNLFRIEFDSKRVYGLDILRATAILIVIFAHGSKILPHSLAKINEMILPDGVFLFFVLSGFLIGSILIKILETREAKIKTLFGFWIRRWFRTLPNYLLILTILVLIRYIFQNGFPDTSVWKYFLFIQNLHHPHPLFFSEAWTLSVEEWFYLTVPIIAFSLVGIFKIRPKKSLITAACGLVILSIIFRLYRYHIHPVTTVTEWDLYFRKEVITRLDSLMFGVIGAYIAYYHSKKWVQHKYALFYVGLAIIFAEQLLAMYATSGSNFSQPLINFYFSVLSFSVTAAGILALLPLLSDIKKGSGRAFTFLTHVSIASYSMYLIHVSLVQPFAYMVTKFEAPFITTFIRYILYWALTILGAILLYKYFEKPTTELREKFVKSKKSHISTTMDREVVS